MTQKEVVSALRKEYGIFLSRKQVLRAVGITGHGAAANDFLSMIGSFSLTEGGQKRYFADDVAKVILERSQV